MENGTEVPSYITQLFENNERAFQYLYPHGRQDGQVFTCESVTYNSKANFFHDEATGDTGDLFALWQHRYRQTPERARDGVIQFLRNLDGPSGMERFCFSPDQMSGPIFQGDSFQVFPDVNFYAGTTTLLAGYNGSGKSTLAYQICNIATLYGHKSFILSPEMPPATSARIIQRQSTHVSNPTDDEWRRTAKHAYDHFLISTTEDRLTPDSAIDQFNRAYDSGCRVLVLDSLTCVRTGHELHQQADFADRIRNWTRSHPDAYVLILAHMRKPSNNGPKLMSRYDIRGAGEVSDLAGHVWLVARKNPFDKAEVASYGDMDAKLIVDKNRATGIQTCKMLRFANVQRLFYYGNRIPSYVDFDYSADNVTPIGAIQKEKN